VKVGDLVRWTMAPGKAYYNDKECYGIMIRITQNDYTILWSDGLQGDFDSSEPVAKFAIDVVNTCK